MDLILQLLTDHYPAVIILIGGWIAAKCWIGKTIKSIGEAYKVLEKAEEDQIIRRDEYAAFGEAAMPGFVELRKRARGLTFLKMKF